MFLKKSFYWQSAAKLFGSLILMSGRKEISNLTADWLETQKVWVKVLRLLQSDYKEFSQKFSWHNLSIWAKVIQNSVSTYMPYICITSKMYAMMA